MKSSAHQYREGLGLVAVHGRGICYGMGKVGMRKDWGRMGECYFEENGGWSYRLTLGSGSQSQTAGLGVGLLSNWYVSHCSKTPTSSQKNKIIPSTQNPLPIISQHSNISPLFPIWYYPLLFVFVQLWPAGGVLLSL